MRDPPAGAVAASAAAVRDHSPSRTQTRLCCRHGPEAAWASAQAAEPSKIRAAASPILIKPVAMTGFAPSGPPDGLTRTSPARPSASRRISSSWLNWACNSATSGLAAPAAPTDPTDPTASTAQAALTDPTAPADPKEPKEPKDPEEPADAARPTSAGAA